MSTPPLNADDLRIEPNLGSASPASSNTSHAQDAPHSDSWARDALIDLARQGLIEQRRARRWRLFFRLISFALLIGFFGWLVFNGDLNDSQSLDLSQPTAAIIDVSGVIAAGQEASADELIPLLERAFKAPQIKGIVLRMNTPGGSPVQSGEVFDAIMRLRKDYPAKPIYAVVEDICASGGYYIAAATDKIYANQASLVGSIGVRMDGFGFVDAMNKLGIQSRLLTSGANKAMLNPFTPENPTQVQYMQSLLDQVHQQFIDAVKQGRGDRLAQDPDLFSGLIYTGAAATKNGLIDGLGTVRSVIRDQMHLEHEINLTPQKTPFEQLLGATSTQMSQTLTSVWSSNLGPKLLP
ncbi:MAG: S49 family peptidase [Halothiobacillus sp. 20-53-49]|nr:S49 family peptidase [Halothiobacillaceae bacterium]OYV46655.1 MAG: S49 family peptidase [Halothiobacillus sp. 20-53-49]HUN00186.1 S49 family peptidase [Halothiobacillus sp.]